MTVQNTSDLLEIARFSMLAYQSPEQIDSIALPSDYVHEQFGQNTENGFNANAFYSADTNTVVIGFAGTGSLATPDGWVDW